MDYTIKHGPIRTRNVFFYQTLRSYSLPNDAGSMGISERVAMLGSKPFSFSDACLLSFHYDTHIQQKSDRYCADRTGLRRQAKQKLKNQQSATARDV